MNYLTLSILAGLAAVFYGIWQTIKILKLPKGTPNMVAIADAISEGAQAYLKRQYQIVAVIAVIIALLLYATLGQLSAVTFLIGALCSAIAGFVGMNVAVRTNVRCSEAAKRGLPEALAVGFSGGSVTGLLVAGLALLAVSITFLIINNLQPTTYNLWSPSVSADHLFLSLPDLEEVSIPKARMLEQTW